MEKRPLLSIVIPTYNRTGGGDIRITKGGRFHTRAKL